MRITATGELYVMDSETLECRWIDYYLNKLFDPHLSDEALLKAMGALRSDEEPTKDKSEEDPTGEHYEAAAFL